MQNKGSNKRWFVFCEPCGFKRILNSSDGNEPDLGNLTNMKISDIPGGVPELDPITNKTIHKKSTKSAAKVKCSKCGRAVTVKKLPDVYSKSFKQIDEEEQKRRHDQEREKRIQDGIPKTREKDPDFLG